MTVFSWLTQKWFDQNHTSRSTKPISALSAASIRILASLRKSWRRLHLGLRSVTRLPLLIRVALGVIFEDGAVGGAARRQIGVRDLPGSRAVQLRNQRPARIACNRLDRAGAGAEPKPVQSQRCLLRIASHLPNPATTVCGIIGGN